MIKSDGNIRIYRVSLLLPLQSSILYPLPRVEDLFTALSGGKLFTKFDLSHAYQQSVLDENSRKYTTIKGLFQYQCLLFEISSAPSDVSKRFCYKVCQVSSFTLMISWSLDLLRKSNLNQVVDRLESVGVTLKESFATMSVEYLGHIINEDGHAPISGETSCDTGSARAM